MTVRQWTGVIIHHTAGARYQTYDSIERDQVKRGYACIAYHYIFIRDRATDRLHLKAGRPLDKLGCHGNSYHNRNSLGICIAGNYSVDELTEQDFRDVAAGVKHIMVKHGIATDRIWGHREVKATACPGDKFPLKRLKQAIV